jgi:hypothetical protein
MTVDEIEVGATYMLGGHHKSPRRVVFLDRDDPRTFGGRLVTVNTTSSKTRETWSAEIFAKRVIEKIQAAE